MKKIIFLILVFTSSLSSLLGQEREDSIILITKHYQDSIALKWAPNSAYGWYLGVTNGYRIERKTNNGDWETLDNKHMPWAKEKIEQSLIADEHQDNLIVQYSCLYDDWDNVSSSTDNLHDFMYKSEIFKNRYFMALMSSSLDKTAAMASGLTYVDSNVSSTDKYMYRVGLLSDDGEVMLSSDSEEVTQKTLPKLALFTEVTDYNVELNWDRIFAEEHYIAYKVERRVKNTNKWQSLTDVPIVFGLSQHADNPEFITIKDTLQDGKAYEYRLRGIDMFADEGPQSNIMEVIYTDKTPPLTGKFESGEVLEDNQIQLKWNHPDINDVLHFAIAKSTTYDGPFDLIHEHLLPASQTTILDTDQNPSGNTYYVIYAFDKAGNYSVSLPYAVTVWDHTAPDIPTNVKGIVDTTGLVSLTWDKNTESDLAGYRIFASQSKRNFINIVDLTPNNHFKESLKIGTHDEFYFYKIAAVDKSGNISDFSEMIEIHLPDITPPSAPSFTIAKQVEGHILLEWKRSISPDVVSYEILRKSDVDDDFYKHATVGGQQSNFEDHDIDLSMTYRYKLRCIDDANNTTNCSTVKLVKCNPYWEKASFVKTEAKYEQTSNAVVLNWEIDNPSVEKVWILKSSNGKDFIDKAYVSSDSSSFTDTKIQSKSKYTYQLIPIKKNGSHGTASLIMVAVK